MGGDDDVIEYATGKFNTKYGVTGMIESPEMSHAYYRNTGKRLKALRELFGYSVDGAAIRYRMSPGKLRAVEAGVIPVSTAQLESMCKVYGITLKEFLKG